MSFYGGQLKKPTCYSFINFLCSQLYLIHLIWPSSSFRLNQVFTILKVEMLFFPKLTCPCPDFSRMRVNSASRQVGPSQRGPVISYIAYYMYFPRYFHKGYQYEVCFIYKNVQQKFKGIMFGSIYISGLSILFHSMGLTS